MNPDELQEDRERLRRFYETSHEYKKLLDAHNREYLKPYVDTVHKYAPAEAKILDMGCGNGLSAYMLNEYGHWVVGSDISWFFLSDFARFQSNKLKYQVCDALNLSFADNSFDVICSNELIEHITDAPGVLSEMMRVLRNDGILVITGPNLCSPVWAAMDFINMLLGKSGRETWAETKIQALKWGFKNFKLSLKKRFSSQAEFIYRRPNIEQSAKGGDSDSAYYVSPIDLEKFLMAHGMKIIKLYEPTTFRGRILSAICPRFSPFINMVAQKSKK